MSNENNNKLPQLTKIKRGRASYFYSIIGVALVLFILGTLGLLVINAGLFSNELKESLVVEVSMNDNTRNENADKLYTILKTQSFTKSCEIIYKEQAKELYKKMTGDNYIDKLDHNPLYTSINLHLYSDYMNKDSLEKIENFIKLSNIVREVSYLKYLVDVMNSKVRRIGIVVLGISIVFIFFVIILIDNTIRLAMYSNRFLIKTMQMVGATRWFIAQPFNIRSIINGIISAGLAIIGIFCLKFFIESWIPELSSISSNKWITILCCSILFLGIIISFLSTHRSVIKYLRTQLDDLY